MIHTNTRRGFTQEMKKVETNIGQVKPDVSRKQSGELSGSRLTYKGCSGFTLIELLVVVLIIGILSAVALPQYNKAVKKAYAREVLVALDALDKAIHTYVLETGRTLCGQPMTPGCRILTAADLPVEMPALKHFQYAPACSGSSSLSEDFQRLDANCTGVAFFPKEGGVILTAKWDQNTGVRKPGTLCSGKKCGEYFNCVSEESNTVCQGSGAPKETCSSDKWDTSYKCYLD